MKLPAAIQSSCLLLLLLSSVVAFTQKQTAAPPAWLNAPTWTADNGNGTFTNPLFFDEFSDPDLIRVGDDYYLTGTTMHTMPGLPVLHSRDLVNWEFMSYAVDRLDLGPAFRLENNGSIYGQGIWAPCFRYHKGKFYIFSNVNRHNTQVFTADNPKGPWAHYEMRRSFHDLSVLFDDDGKTYVVWGYDELHLAQLNDSLTDVIAGSEQVIVPAGSGAGEGCHFYKIDGRYYITNTNYDPVCYQVCLRSSHPRGPYEIQVISAKESFGFATGWRLAGDKTMPFKLTPPVPNLLGAMPIHQGGIVQVQSGEWWAWSMMDGNSVGRLTCLSPVTWENGWPYLGLPGNLTRSPQTWIKPNTGFTSTPKAPYRRSDDFAGTSLQPVWQWNHVPVDSKWSLTARKGYLRLNALPATNLRDAKNTLTQRAVGPESIVTTEAEVSKLKTGDVAGLAFLNHPYAWIGIAKTATGLELQQFNQQTGKLTTAAVPGAKFWLRVQGNFETENALFSYSTDGISFIPLGEPFIMVFQLNTFQGIRYGLFNYNTLSAAGGYADFNWFEVKEPRPRGLTNPIPYNKIIVLSSMADSTVLTNWKGFVRPVPANSSFAQGNKTHFKIIDKGNGRVALQSVADGGWVTVKGIGAMAEVRIEKEAQGDASVFQWQDLYHGELMLHSLHTHRYLLADPYAKSLCSADAPGTRPDRKDGACFTWVVVE